MVSMSVDSKLKRISENSRFYTCKWCLLKWLSAGNSNLRSKGHLCLWREDSLKKKYNTKYYKIHFYLFFRVITMQISFDGQKHIFWQFLLWLRHNTSAGMNIKDALLQNITIMASYCTFNFYSHRS